jgi:hypothetical protein
MYNDGKRGSSSVKLNRQAQVVPELVSEIAKLDAQLVALTGIVRDKSAVSRLISKVAARDFKINLVSVIVIMNVNVIMSVSARITL